MYDCIIVGMGPAGMSAAIYANESGLKTLILEESTPGGLLNKVSIVNNYLGFPNISGSDLAFKMFEHIRNENIEYKIARVLDIKDKEDYKVVTTTIGEFKTKGIILSTGRKLKKSGIPNEDKFINKGISYCAICDGYLFKNKNVVVLGNNQTAESEANYLSKICNVKRITEQKVIEFIGNEYLEGIKLEDGNVIKCDAAFVYYGYMSSTSFIKNYDITDEKGYVIVDKNMKSKCNMIYACGDIVKKDLYQVSTAVSEGAIAAISLSKEIKEI